MNDPVHDFMYFLLFSLHGARTNRVALERVALPGAHCAQMALRPVLGETFHHSLMILMQSLETKMLWKKKRERNCLETEWRSMYLTAHCMVVKSSAANVLDKT